MIIVSYCIGDLEHERTQVYQNGQQNVDAGAVDPTPCRGAHANSIRFGRGELILQGDNAENEHEGTVET